MLSDLPLVLATSVGHRGAGKTVYLKSACDVMDIGRKGFSLRCEDRGLAHDLRTESRFMQQQRRFPPGTMSQEELAFVLSFDGFDLMRLLMIDYKGGLLLEDPRANDVATLFEHINRSDVLVLFVDGFALATDTLDEEEVWSFNEILGRYFAANPKKDVSIALILTKSDGLGLDATKPELCADLIRKAYRRFRRLFDVEVKSELANRLATIIPVSATGPVCKWVGCGNDGYFKIVETGFVPQAVELPFFWAAHFGMANVRNSLVARLDALKSEISAAAREERSAQQKASSIIGVLHDVWQSWWSNPTHNDVARRASRLQEVLRISATEAEDKLRTIRSAFEEVQEDLSRYPLFSRASNSFEKV